MSWILHTHSFTRVHLSILIRFLIQPQETRWDIPTGIWPGVTRCSFSLQVYKTYTQMLIVNGTVRVLRVHLENETFRLTPLLCHTYYILRITCTGVLGVHDNSVNGTGQTLISSRPSSFWGRIGHLPDLWLAACSNIKLKWPKSRAFQFWTLLKSLWRTVEYRVVILSRRHPILHLTKLDDDLIWGLSE